MSTVWEIQWPSQSALLVALKMADRSNDEGHEIWPSHETLAKSAHTSVSTVRRILRSFVQIGLLVIDQRGGSGPGSTNVYSFDLPLLINLRNGGVVLLGTNDEMTLAGRHEDPAKVFTVNTLPNGEGAHDDELRCSPSERQYIPLDSSLKKEEESVRLEEGKLKCSAKYRAEWKGLGIDGPSLDLALVQILPYVQENSRRPLEAQVSSQLARIARDKRDKDQRYASAAATSSFSRKPLLSRQSDKVSAAANARAVLERMAGETP